MYSKKFSLFNVKFKKLGFSAPLIVLFRQGCIKETKLYRLYIFGKTEKNAF